VPALAAEVTLTWTAPTTNDDGSPLTDLAGYKIHQGPDGVSFPQVYDIPDPLATSYVVTGLAEGTYYFAATAYDTSDNESVLSNIVNKALVTAPAPPGGLTISNLTVFTIVKQENRFVLVAVGTAPAGTPCDNQQSVNGRYAVSRDSVTWSGNIEPLVVVADCS
jgi:hypothetical protein